MTRKQPADDAHSPSDDELQQMLDDLGKREAFELAHADETRGPGDTEARILQVMMGESDVSVPEPSPWRRRLGWAAFVVLGGLVSFLVFDHAEDPVRPGDVLLGLSEVRAVEPVGRVPGWDDFRFEGEIPDGGYAVVVVLAVGAEPVRSPPLDGLIWTPEPIVTRDWGRIEWWVEMMVGANQPKVVGRSAVAVAERR